VPANRLAVDLSGGPIRALEGMLGGPMRCGESGIPEHAIEGGRIVDPELVGNTLRQVLARAEITANRALIAASDRIASFRVLTFPTAATETEIDTAVKAQMPSTPERLALRRTEVLTGRPDRTVYATVWDRDQVRAIAESAKHAGLDAAVVDLKSLCVARAVPVPNCIVLDLSSQPIEVILIEEHIPRAWHSFKVEPDGDLPVTLAAGLKPVLSFYRSNPGSGIGPDSPIVVRSDQLLPSSLSERLEELAGHPVLALPQLARVDPELRFGAFLTCVGLIMRRRT
jgi:hypothetical protein